MKCLCQSSESGEVDTQFHLTGLRTDQSLANADIMTGAYVSPANLYQQH